MTEVNGAPIGDGRRPVSRPGPGGNPAQRRRRRPVYDPPARSFGELVQRLWFAGPVAVLVVVVVVLASGPGNISILRRLFIWFSTFAFSLWLLREHRRRVPVQQRRLIFLVCGASLALLFLVLTITAF